MGLVLLIIPGLALITIWCLIIPAIVLEQTGTLAAFGRSLQLVRGYFWNVFGTLVLLWLILIVVDIVLGAIFSFMPHLLGHFLGSVIGGTVIAPFISVVLTSMYFRLVAAPAGGPVNAGAAYGTAEPVWLRHSGYLRRSAARPAVRRRFPAGARKMAVSRRARKMAVSPLRRRDRQAAAGIRRHPDHAHAGRASQGHPWLARPGLIRTAGCRAPSRDCPPARPVLAAGSASPAAARPAG